MTVFGLLTLTTAAVCAQSAAQKSPTPPALSVTVGDRQIALEVPAPFVDASRILPQAFALRQETIPATNQLLAWFIPTAALRDRLNGVLSNHRALQVQVLREMTSHVYDERAFAAVRQEMRLSMPRAAEFANAAMSQVFSKPKFAEIPLRVGVQRSLGILDESGRHTTFGLVGFVGGPDQQVTSVLSIVSYTLIRSKVLLLVVSSPEASATELVDLQQLSRAWLELLWQVNP